MTFRAALHRRAAAVRGTVALAEGWDRRVAEAAATLERDRIARVLSVGRSAADDPRVGRVADLLAARRPDKVDRAARARELAADPVLFAAGLVALGEADAAVAGATCPTGDVVRAALWAIGPAEGIATVSSAFYMALPWGVDPPHGMFRAEGAGEAVLTFTDAGVVPDPSSEQLAEIAMSAARDRRIVVGDEPVVAFLSYSTKGSAEGPRVAKVREAARRFEELAPEIASDGELQGDAALVAEVAGRKAPGSAAAGHANVLVFPDLDSGNIAYKLVQRLAGATATGPIVQGLARPMADISRGAVAADIVDVAAVALLQAQGSAVPGREEEQ